MKRIAPVLLVMWLCVLIGAAPATRCAATRKSRSSMGSGASFGRTSATRMRFGWRRGRWPRWTGKS